ncbi:GntR family transcriptional regulator [Sulfitobacter sp. Ks41]|uniref:GntR family transcriptional regulator n=1 Tax=unclassified Sulfitobacter TaxID=196795 RepID=UPI0023E24B46|nr:GntR family transcriptional regulator [Sulfitobacter sp. Ks41]MDF3362830.1 GntR family transcriptional regulator [Sulfitobacter sp. Ks41]
MTEKIETLGDATFKRLKAMILDGTLEPGTRLSEKKFADHLGVSRTPVREAIGQLVSEGLAKRSAGSAPVVSSVSLNEIMEILHVRSLLECEAARKAASSGKSTTELIDIRNKIQGFIDGPRPTAAEHSALDMRLHFILAEMAGSNLLLELIESLKVKTGMYDQGSIPDRLVPGCEEHIALIDAVIAKEPDAASAAMKLHLSNVRESIISHIYHPF